MSIKKQFNFILFFVGAITVSGGLLFASQQPANAADTNGFNPENIISDGVFTNQNSMSVAQIQSFLDSRGSACLANFRTQSLNDLNGDGMGDEPYGKGVNEQVSAATVIWQAAQLYRINPQVILATLEKEQGLVTRTDCPNWRYNTALGYGCPDTQPCDNAAYGFTRQIDYGVWHFRGFFDDTYPVPPTVVGSKYIAYNPSSSCGGKTITIQNRATAALYSYTPYQPNAASLAAARGQVVACGAYGNLNFWRYFNDWFDPYSTVANNLYMNILSQPDTTPALGQDVSYVVQYKNNLPYPVTLDAVSIVGRLGNSTSGANRDFGWQGPITLAAGASRTFTFTTTVTDNGTLYAWPSVVFQGRYIQYNNWGVAMVSHAPNLSVTTPLSLSPTDPVTGQNVTLSATIKNNEDQPIKIQAAGIPVRFYGAYNYDVAWQGPITLAPGATQSLSGSIVFDKPGPYTSWVSAQIGNQYVSLSPTIAKTVVTPKPNFILTYTQLPNSSPAVGETIEIGFKLKNNLSSPITVGSVGAVGRYGSPSSGTNGDLSWTGPQTFTPGEEKSYTMSTTITRPDKFHTWIAVYQDGAYTQYNNYGFTLTSRYPNVTISSPLTINSGNAFSIGQSVPVRVTIQNNEPKPIKFSAIGIPIRFYGVYNYDATWEGNITLSALGTSGDSKALTGSVIFDKPGPYTVWTSLNQNGTYRTIGTPINIQM